MRVHLIHPEELEAEAVANINLLSPFSAIIAEAEPSPKACCAKPRLHRFEGVLVRTGVGEISVAHVVRQDSPVPRPAEEEPAPYPVSAVDDAAREGIVQQPQVLFEQQGAATLVPIAKEGQLRRSSPDHG